MILVRPVLLDPGHIPRSRPPLALPVDGASRDTPSGASIGVGDPVASGADRFVRHAQAGAATGPSGVRLALWAGEGRAADRAERRTVVLVNPAAGGGADGDRATRLEASFARAGLSVRVQILDPVRIEATVASLLSEGFGTIVAAGGDGTVSAVAAHVAGTPARLGVIPLGTLNHFAKDLGLPLDLDDAVDVVAGGATRSVDVGSVNDRLFLNNAALGLYPDQVRMRQRLRGRWSKPVAALIASIAALRRVRSLWLTLEAGGARRRRLCAMAVVGNGVYGLEAGTPVARSRLDEGVLSLLLFSESRRLGIVLGALRTLTGRASAVRSLEIERVTAVVVHVGRRRVPVALDGEVTSLATPLRFRTLPGALRVVGPVGRS